MSNVWWSNDQDLTSNPENKIKSNGHLNIRLSMHFIVYKNKTTENITAINVNHSKYLYWIGLWHFYGQINMCLKFHLRISTSDSLHEDMFQPKQRKAIANYDYQCKWICVCVYVCMKANRKRDCVSEQIQLQTHMHWLHQIGLIWLDLAWLGLRT